jgi:allantoin racemase
MNQRIIVINPNSTQAVTDDMDSALDALRRPDGPAFECMTLAEGPPGIESQRLADQVIMPLCRLVESHDNRADAFVIACFSDPGLHAVRETTAKPVFGIAESGLLTAMGIGERVGIIAMLETSIRRHRRFLRALGIESRIAGEIPVGLGILEMANEKVTLARMIEAGERLRDEHGADVLVMGCAGMARYRGRMEDALGLPVIDPTQAAVGMAMTALTLDYKPARLS